MKKNFVIPILIVFAVVLFLGCTQPPVIPPVTPGTGVANSGTFLLAVKDKAPDSSLLGSVTLTISSVSIHSQSGDSWIVLSNETKEFDLLGKTAESNALTMHATMLAAWPSISYALPETVQAMQKIWSLRREGLPLYFTQDAGSNLKLLFLDKDKDKIIEQFPLVDVIKVFE